jgi:hypothetical protein
VNFGNAWKLGTVLLDITEGFYCVHKRVKKNGKVYFYDEYVLRSRSAALKAFKTAMRSHSNDIGEVASKVASNLHRDHTHLGS